MNKKYLIQLFLLCFFSVAHSQEKILLFDYDEVYPMTSSWADMMEPALNPAQDAVNKLLAAGRIAASPIRSHVAAISVGIVQGTPLLDLEYTEDSACDTDMNVVMTASGGFVEVQGTAEGAAFTRDEMNALLVLADKGIRDLVSAQKRALGV